MKHSIHCALGLMVVWLALPLPVLAADLSVAMHKVTQDGVGDSAGTITINVSSSGASFKLDLRDLPPGPHGFHVHENANCSPTLLNNVRIPGGGAGGHLDPEHTGKHEGPAGGGHLGDLPVLQVGADGTATQTLLAPRIKDAGALSGRALMIHSGGDNYSDQPNALGGGGGRIACGEVR